MDLSELDAFKQLACLALPHLRAPALQSHNAWDTGGYGPTLCQWPAGDTRSSVPVQDQGTLLTLGTSLTKAQRGSGFASPEHAMTLMCPASHRVALAPPGLVPWKEV